MNSVLLSYFVVGLLILLIVRLLVRWAITPELVSEIYRRAIYPRRMSRAYQNAETGQSPRTSPDDQDYRAKLEELSAFRYERRKLAIRYFLQVPPTQDLVNKLLEVIPQQHHDDVKMEMIHLLCRSMHELQTADKAGQTFHPSHKFDIQSRIVPWSRAISIWLTIIIMMGVGLISKPTLSVAEFFAAGLATFVVATLALLIIVQDRSRVFRYGLAFLAVVMGGLWWYSANAHTGLAVTPRQSLSAYGFPQVEVEIRYPRWLTAEDINTCSKTVVINLVGDPLEAPLPLEATLDFNTQVLYAVDEKCAPAQSLTIAATNKNSASVLEALRPLNLEGLSTGAVWVTLLIRNPNKSERPRPVIETAFLVQLEESAWNSIRDICRTAFGATTASAFLWMVYDRLIRKKDKS